MTKLNASKRPNNANYSLRKRLQNHRIQKQEQVLNKNVKADRFASLPGSSNNEKYGLDSSQTKTKKMLKSQQRQIKFSNLSPNNF